MNIVKITNDKDVMRLMLEEKRPLQQVFGVENVMRGYTDEQSGYFGVYKELCLSSAYQCSAWSDVLFVHDIVGAIQDVWLHIRNGRNFVAYVRKGNMPSLGELEGLFGLPVFANSTRNLDYAMLHSLFNYVLPQENGYVIASQKWDIPLMISL
jgi:hypothetical protein